MNRTRAFISACGFVVLSAVVGSANGAGVYQYVSTPHVQEATGPQDFHGQRMRVVLTFADLLAGNAVNLSVCASGCSTTVHDFDADGGSTDVVEFP